MVEVSPEGFVMSKRCFKTLPELFKWFKGNAQQLGRSSRSGRKVTGGGLGLNDQKKDPKYTAYIQSLW